MGSVNPSLFGDIMSEINLTWLASGNVLLLAFACLCYSLGGREGGPGKGIRRFVASAIIAIAINGTAYFLGKWVWQLLFLFPICILTFIQGYGGHSMPKIIQRILIVATSLLSGFLCMYSINGGVWLFAIHAVVALTTVIFALKNPIVAAAEEVLVCLLLFAIPLFYPFVI